MSQGPTTARMKTRKITPPATSAMRFRFSLRQASPQKPTGGPVISSGVPGARLHGLEEVRR